MLSIVETGNRTTQLNHETLLSGLEILFFYSVQIVTLHTDCAHVEDNPQESVLTPHLSEARTPVSAGPAGPEASR